jgi:hypothetical protein
LIAALHPRARRTFWIGVNPLRSKQSQNSSLRDLLLLQKRTEESFAGHCRLLPILPAQKASSICKNDERGWIE